MNRDAILLQGLRDKLQNWIAFIRKSAMASEVKIESTGNSEFSVVVRWTAPEPGEYKKLFDRPTVFGRSMQLSPLAWSVQHCAGEFARQVVREVLSHRGV